MKNNIFWAVLLERSIQEWAVQSLLNVALDAGGIGAKRMILPYMATDAARNRLVRAFCEMTQEPDDVLIMLDCDHTHPQRILQMLARHKVGVVGALAFMRHPPHNPCAFVRGKDGKLHAMATWEQADGLIECSIVGTGAIAIKRWVFDRLAKAGMEPPYFRYEYNNDKQHRTEDMYFGACCEAANISHYVDIGCEIPHLTTGEITHDSWSEWLNDNPDQMTPAEDMGRSKAETLQQALDALKGDPIPAGVIPANIITRLSV